MAVIRDELVVIDNASQTFTSVLNVGNQVSKAFYDVGSSSQQMGGNVSAAANAAFTAMTEAANSANETMDIFGNTTGSVLTGLEQYKNVTADIAEINARNEQAAQAQAAAMDAAAIEAERLAEAEAAANATQDNFNLAMARTNEILGNTQYERYADQLDAIERQMQNSANQLQTLNVQYQTAITTYGATSTEAEKYRDKVDALATSLNVLAGTQQEVQAELEKTVADAEAAGQSLEQVSGTRLNRQFLRLGTQLSRTFGTMAGVPPIVKQIISLSATMTTTFAGAGTAANGMASGLSASGAAASGFMATLGPLIPIITVAAGTLISAIIQNANDQTSSLEELQTELNNVTQKYSNVISELSSAHSSIRSNNELIEKMNELGVDSSFATRLEKENALLETQVKLLNAVAYQTRLKEAKAAYDLVNSTENQGVQIKVAANTTHASETRSDYKVDAFEYAEQVKMDFVDAFNSVLDLPIDISLPEISSSGWDSFQMFASGNVITDGMYDVAAAATEMAQQAQEMADAMRDVDGYEATVAELDKLVERYVDLYGGGEDVVKIQNDMQDAIEEATAAVAAQEKAIEDAQKAHDDYIKSLKDQVSMSKNYKDTVIDLKAQVEGLAEAHEILSAAVGQANSSDQMNLETFYQLMALEPEYISLLLTEQGTVQDLDAATQFLTQSKIEEMGVTMALSLLDLAEKYQSETGSLEGYSTQIQNTTKDLWGMVAAQRALLYSNEIATYTEKGYSQGAAEYFANKNLKGIDSQIATMQEWTAQVQASVGSGVSAITSPTVSKVDKVGSVGSVKDVSLADEDLKMLKDIAERKNIVNINTTHLTPDVKIEVNNTNGDKLDESKIGSAVKKIIDDQLAAHTDSSYTY